MRRCTSHRVKNNVELAFQGLTDDIVSHFLGDDPTQCADRVIDLAGGIRNLLFGPYIALPPGAWTTTVTQACINTGRRKNSGRLPRLRR